jgi:hypothetical protein
MAIVNLMGGSRRTKDELKGIYTATYDTIVPGSGITMEVKEIVGSEDFISDPNLVPWASKTLKELVISASADFDLAVMAPIALALAESVTSDLEDYVDNALAATVSGYTGTIVVSGSVTLTVVNGLITTYA